VAQLLGQVPGVPPHQLLEKRGRKQSENMIIIIKIKNTIKI